MEILISNYVMSTLPPCTKMEYIILIFYYEWNVRKMECETPQ
ncbi:unnamed protein product [Tenebrio molitor]|nr:unnamed protein product [Tenebrio molitor]